MGQTNNCHMIHTEIQHLQIKIMLIRLLKRKVFDSQILFVLAKLSQLSHKQAKINKGLEEAS